jgi:hypothetical protein
VNKKPGSVRTVHKVKSLVTTGPNPTTYEFTTKAFFHNFFVFKMHWVMRFVVNVHSAGV